ncbi:MAG: SAV_2336 N-terminal domain-related protein [Cyanobacteria bacterium J06576_12]
MIDQLISRLQAVDLTLTHKELADALWLAGQLDAPSEKDERSAPEPDQDNVQVRVEEAGPLESALSPLSAMPLYAADAIASEDPSEEPAAPEGLPFKAPAATALPNAIALSRAMRSLSRKVPSQTRVELDEAATVEQIAAQRIFVPVVRPALERWLDLELVVEDSEMSFVWRQTVEDLRKKVLERLGAFRNARTWRLKADDVGQLKLWPYLPGRGKVGGAAETTFAGVRPRSPKVLMHPSGRRLILLVSDCQSPLWQARPQRAESGQKNGGRGSNPASKPTIYDWLQRWAQQGPTTVVQLLPERLWAQTELGYGDAVQLSALLPGVANVNLTVEGATDWQAMESMSEIDIEAAGSEAADAETAGYRTKALPLPVVTLEAGPMRQWAKVVAGRGNERTPGF